MLPSRTSRITYLSAIFAGCFLATPAWSQSVDSAEFYQPIHQNDPLIGGVLDLGPAAIDLNLAPATKKQELESYLTNEPDYSNNATFTLRLSEPESGDLFPETLNLTTRNTDLFGRPQFSVGSPATPVPSDQTASDYVISADWGSPEDRFTFSFSSRFQSDRPQTGEAVDVSDEMLNFTRTLKTGGWLSSFTASIGRGSREEIGNKERIRKFGAEANFKSSQTAAPLFDITAKFLQDRTSGLNSGSSDIDTKWELRTDSNLFGGRSRNDLTTQPSLSIFFSLKGNAPDEEEKDVNPVDFTAGVAGKVKF